MMLEYYKIKDPRVLLLNMNKIEFDRWLRTDMYGIVHPRHSEDLLRIAYFAINDIPELEDYETYIINKLKDFELEK